jgi:glycosyltransferase involved in cell wall biosynthesis
LDESPKQSTKLLFGAYGSARYEKGSDILQSAIRLFLERNVTSNVHFAIQWINDFYDAQGNMIQVDSYLRNHPRVKIFDTYFQGNGYLEQVDATDALLLPYRSEYALRVSRVVIEAMIYGKPVIATLGTTLYEQAEEYGAVVPCDDESVESLVRAIETMSYSYPQLKLHANQRAEIAEDHFSVKTFRCSLLAHWGLA